MTIEKSAARYPSTTAGASARARHGAQNGALAPTKGCVQIGARARAPSLRLTCLQAKFHFHGKAPHDRDEKTNRKAHNGYFRFFSIFRENYTLSSQIMTS